MKDDQMQESDDDMDDLIRGLMWLLDDLGEDLALMAAIMAYPNASEQ